VRGTDHSWGQGGRVLGVARRCAGAGAARANKTRRDARARAGRLGVLARFKGAPPAGSGLFTSGGRDCKRTDLGGSENWAGARPRAPGVARCLLATSACRLGRGQGQGAGAGARTRRGRRRGAARCPLRGRTGPGRGTPRARGCGARGACGACRDKERGRAGDGRRAAPALADRPRDAGPAGRGAPGTLGFVCTRLYRSVHRGVVGSGEVGVYDQSCCLLGRGGRRRGAAGGRLHWDQRPCASRAPPTRGARRLGHRAGAPRAPRQRGSSRARAGRISTPRSQALTTGSGSREEAGI
jgi:hypothetical protein